MPRRPHLHALAAVLLCAALVMGGWMSATHAASPDDRKRASELYREGEALFKKELYLAAIEKFQKAHEIIPHEVNLYNIARAYEKLGDADNCVKGYEAYVDFYKRRNRGKDPKDITDVRASIAKCQLLQKPEITVESDPPGASIYIDDKDKLVGQTPAKLKLDPGKYRLYLNLNGHVPFEQDLDVRTGQPLTLRFKLEKFQRVGQVRVKSNVRGASLFIDGRNIGLTPYTDLITLDEGPHQIAVNKDEYVPFNKEVDIVVNEQMEIVGEIYLRDAPYTWKGYVGWTAIALGAGGIVGGVLAGSEADKYFNDTDDFDKYAGLQKIAYGVGGTLIGGGIALVVLEALDTESVKPQDELDPVASSPTVTPLISGSVLGADVKF